MTTDFEANSTGVRYTCAPLTRGRSFSKKSGEVYVLRHIASGFEEQAFTAEYHRHSKDTAFGGQEEHTPSRDERAEHTKPKRRAAYLLRHRRFAYLGHKKLKHLYKVTTLEKPILVDNRPDLCEVCQLTKMRK